MSKTVWIMISLALSILSLVYIFMAYYGINRYLSLHAYSTESYLEEYPKLTSADEKGRVIISMTTDYDTLLKNKAVLNSLLDQTVRVDRILINIPGNGNNKNPEFLKGQYFMKVYYLGKDYGEANKYLPALMTAKDTNTKIIVLGKDNIIYGKDYIQDLVEKSMQNDSIIIKQGDDMVLQPKFFTTDFYNNVENGMLDKYIKQHHIPIDEIKYNENYPKIW